MPLNPAPNRQRVLTFATPKVADLIFFESEDVATMGTIPEYGTAHWDRVGFPDHKLVFVKVADEQGLVMRFYYAAVRLDQDDYNWEHTLPGPSGAPYEAVTRTYISYRDDYDPAVPAGLSAMPLSEEDPFTEADSYVLFSRAQRRIGQQELDALFIVEQRVYVKRIPLHQITYDETFQTNLARADYIYHGTETTDRNGETFPGGVSLAELALDASSPYWGMQDDGILRTVKQLADGWYAITERQVVNTDGAGAATPLLDYYTTTNVTWPAVLAAIRLDTWEKRKGGNVVIPYPVYSQYRYSGPCRVRVQVYWSSTEFVGVQADDALLPIPISIATPYIKLSIPPSLHVADSLVVTNGTEDTVYEYTAGEFPIPATNETEWPESLLIIDRQKPFRGGWMREKYTAYSPEGNVGDTPTFP